MIYLNRTARALDEGKAEIAFYIGGTFGPHEWTDGLKWCILEDVLADAYDTLEPGMGFEIIEPLPRLNLEGQDHVMSWVHHPKLDEASPVELDRPSLDIERGVFIYMRGVA